MPSDTNKTLPNITPLVQRGLWQKSERCNLHLFLAFLSATRVTAVVTGRSDSPEISPGKDHVCTFPIGSAG